MQYDRAVIKISNSAGTGTAFYIRPINQDYPTWLLSAAHVFNGQSHAESSNGTRRTLAYDYLGTDWAVATSGPTIGPTLQVYHGPIDLKAGATVTLVI